MMRRCARGGSPRLSTLCWTPSWTCPWPPWSARARLQTLKLAAWLLRAGLQPCGAPLGSAARMLRMTWLLCPTCGCSKWPQYRRPETCRTSQGRPRMLKYTLRPCNNSLGFAPAGEAHISLKHLLHPEHQRRAVPPALYTAGTRVTQKSAEAQQQ